MLIDIRHLHCGWCNKFGLEFERVTYLNFGIQEMNPSNLGWSRDVGCRLEEESGRGWWWCGGERKEEERKEKTMKEEKEEGKRHLFLISWFQ